MVALICPSLLSARFHPTLRSIKDVFMCKERHHLRSIKDVFRCKGTSSSPPPPHPKPPQTTPVWPPANGYNHGYIYIYLYIHIIFYIFSSLFATDLLPSTPPPSLRFSIPIFWGPNLEQSWDEDAGQVRLVVAEPVKKRRGTLYSLCPLAGFWFRWMDGWCGWWRWLFIFFFIFKFLGFWMNLRQVRLSMVK